jgi:hypothetical protein
MTSQWQPYRESFRTTMWRTGIIAIAAGTVVTLLGGMRIQWLTATLLMLWPSFGGHWVEVWFLNWLRPRLPVARGVQVVARLGVWFVGGTGLAVGMSLTAMALEGFRLAHGPDWWIGGLAFTAIELAAHLVLQLCRRPNFYNGFG